MRQKEIKIFVLLVIPILLYLLPLPFIPLMEPDEGRYSSIPSAMNQTGDYITPRLKAAVYFEKPPLCYWATALSFKIFGENELSSRLFVALCAWGCILLVYRMGVYFHDAKTGLYAAAVLSTFLFHAAIGRINILDMPLAFWVSVSIWCGFRYFVSPKRDRRWLYLLYLFSALAFLTKGLIGIAFPFGVIVVWLIISGRWRDSLKAVSPVGVVIFLAVSLPWLILVQRENPDFFRFFFIQEHLLRYATRMHDRYQPFFFYLPVLLLGTLPWCAFLPRALRFYGRRAGSLFDNTEKRFLLTWFGLILLFFSISSSKLIPYIAPIFLPVALMIGHLFRCDEDRLKGVAEQRGSSAIRRIPIILQSILFMAALLTPIFLEPHRVTWTHWWPWIAIPLILLFMAMFVPNILENRFRTGWFAPTYVIFALFLFSVTFPAAQYISPYKSAHPISEAIKSLLPTGAVPYQYGMSLYGIDFYTGMRTPIVDDIGEVRYGSEQLPRQERDKYFLTSSSFFALAKRGTAIYCATESGEKLETLKKEIPALKVLWHNEAYYLLKIN